jgi:hypothetical protein
MYHYSSQSIGYDPPTYQYFSSGYKLDPTGCPLGDFFITCNNNSLSVVVHSIYFKTGGGSSYFDYPPINWHDTEIRDLTSNKAG